MAVKEKFMVKTVEGDDDLELQARSGESILVKDVRVYNPASNYATLRVEKTTVGYFRVGGTLGNHLAFSPSDSDMKTILGYLAKKGLFGGFPVAEGETFSISGVAQSGAIQQVVYEVYDAGDITNTMENGSQAGDYLFINYGRPSSVSDGDNLISSTQNPAEFPNFPYSQTVPSGHVISLIGILASDIGKTSGGGANTQITKYLKFVKGREVLFDEDRNGIPMIGSAPGSDGTNIGAGYSLIGNYSDVDRREPFMFPEALEFIAGEELNIYLTTDVTAGSANMSTDEAEIGLILKVRKV